MTSPSLRIMLPASTGERVPAATAALARLAPRALVLLALFWGTLDTVAAAAPPQAAPVAPSARFDGAATHADQRLEGAIAELARLREEIAAEIVPRSRTLAQLEQQLTEVRAEYQSAARLFDNRTLEVSNLNRDIKARGDEISYLSNLLSEYARNFEARLHIAELQRHETALDAVRLVAHNAAPGSNDSTGPVDGLPTQIALVVESLDRLDDALGGMRFDGTVVDPEGAVRRGRFVMIGPATIFRSDDGVHVGTAEQRLGSLEPSLVPFLDPVDVAAAASLVERGSGELPFDPTLGSAHKIAATEETLWEHIQAGGPVMVPIFVLAGAAFLVAFYKFVRLLFVRRPSKRALREVLRAIAEHDHAAAARSAGRVGGPTGRMVMAGVEHLGRSRELIEEVMYEVVLQTRLKLQRMLPFIAICAAAAPLLGLLGTVTGIITTFNLITIFGSGDVKTLSGGISQALITTEYGLIVAIPALLLHALLSRKAKGVTDQMEIVAMQVINQVSKSQVSKSGSVPVEPPTRTIVLDARAVERSAGPEASEGASAASPGAPTAGRPVARAKIEPQDGAGVEELPGAGTPAGAGQRAEPVVGGAPAKR